MQKVEAPMQQEDAPTKKEEAPTPIQVLVNNDRKAINLSQMEIMLSAYNFDKSLKHMPKTIFIYDVYKYDVSKKASSVELNNLHIFATLLVDDSLPLTATKRRYKIGLEGSNIIQKTSFKLLGVEQEMENVWIYENKKAQLRVVALPFQDNLADMKWIEKETKKINDEEISKRGELKEKCLKGEEQKNAEKEIKVEKQKKMNLLMEKERYKWPRTFQIECVINSCLQKTDTISICGVGDIDRGRLKDLNEYLEQIKTLFNFPKEQQPQLIVHSCSQQTKDDSELSNSAVSSIIYETEDDNKGMFKRKDWLDSRYFWKHQFDFRTNLLSTKVESNKITNEISSRFITSWRESAIASLGCFGATIQKMLDALNISVVSELDYYSIPQIDEAFKFSSWELEQEITINPFYSKERLKTIFKDQDVSEKSFRVPKKLQEVVFIFFLQTISRQFLQKFNQRAQACKRDQTLMLAEWKIFLKRLYELCFTLSSPKEKELNQKYFNFVCFLIKSSERIKNVMRQQTSISSLLKNTLEKASPKKNIAEKYLLQNSDKFQKREHPNYYNLLIVIFQKCRESEALKNRADIECNLMALKAHKIAHDYIGDDRKIVESIRDLAHVCLVYPTLDPHYRNIINYSQVEIRMAKLLGIVGVCNISAEIYFKNQRLNQANKACKVARKTYKGDERAKKLMEWASMFEKQLEYELAMEYYREAYQSAQTTIVCQDVIRRKLECNKRKKNLEPEQVMLPFEKFVNPENNSKVEFTSQVSLESTYRKIRKSLAWDPKMNSAVLNWEEVEEGDNSYLGSSTYEIQ